MPRNGQQMGMLLEEHGWTRETGGKHVIKMTKPGERPITLPRHTGADYWRGLEAASSDRRA